MITAKKPFTMISPNLAGGGDPSVGRNPTIKRSTFKTQEVLELSNGVPATPPRPTRGGIISARTTGMLTGATTKATAEIVLDGTGSAWQKGFTLKLGDRYVLNSGANATVSAVGEYSGDFWNGGTIAETAESLANAITALPQLTATFTNAGVVTITGMSGPDSNYSDIIISYYTYDQELTTSPISSITQFSGGSPIYGAAVIS